MERYFRRLLLSAFLALPHLAPAQVVTTVVPISPANQPKDDRSAEDRPTEEQFRTYLKLSGIGEQWKAGWIASLEPNWIRVAAPYWPEKFKIDILQEMTNTDITPSVWAAYHLYFSRDMMTKVNSMLHEHGMSGLLNSELGKKFCAEWDLHKDDSQRETLVLTTATIERVYSSDEPLIKASRAKYLSEHPDYKD